MLPPPDPPPSPRTATGVLSDYRGHKALAALVASPLWLALHTGDPGALGAPDTEMAGGDYIRKPVTFTVPAGSKTMTSQGLIIFSGLVPLTIPFLAVWSAQVGGSMLFTLRLVDAAGQPSPVTPPESGQVRVTDGDLTLTL